VSLRIQFGMPNAPSFSKPYIYDDADEHFDFPTSGENVYGSRTFINQP